MNRKGFFGELEAQKGVNVTATSSNPQLVKKIRAHPDAVSSFVKDGIPKMMHEMGYRTSNDEQAGMLNVPKIARD